MPAHEPAALERQPVVDEPIELAEQLVGERRELVLGDDVADDDVAVVVQGLRELVGIDAQGALHAHSRGDSAVRLFGLEVPERPAALAGRPSTSAKTSAVSSAIRCVVNSCSTRSASAARRTRRGCSGSSKSVRRLAASAVAVAGCRQQARHAVLDDLDRAAVVERDDRQRHRHRLGEDQAERLVLGRHGEHVGGRHQRGHVVAAAEEPHPIVEVVVAHHGSQLVEVARFHLLADDEEHRGGNVVA